MKCIDTPGAAFLLAQMAATIAAGMTPRYGSSGPSVSDPIVQDDIVRASMSMAARILDATDIATAVRKK